MNKNLERQVRIQVGQNWRMFQKILIVFIKILACEISHIKLTVHNCPFWAPTCSVSILLLLNCAKYSATKQFAAKQEFTNQDPMIMNE